jgi:hypothetical protein
MATDRKQKLGALPWWVWDAFDDAWSMRFTELVAYYGEHGRAPGTNSGGLGAWVGTQRRQRETMAADRKATLDALAWWVWDAMEDTWNANFERLVSYYEESGRAPPKNGAGLGVWIGNQRAGRATMLSDHRQRLEALPWWAWDALDDKWNVRFAELVAYYEEHGLLVAASAPVLGSWVSRQRKGRVTMAVAHKERLEALPWWSWDPLDDTWNARFAELVAYYAEHGRISAVSEPGLKAWVCTQRSTRDTMAAHREEKLGAMPWWSWDVFDDTWNARFCELVSYYDEHRRAPYKRDASGLGSWVGNQRRLRDTMAKPRQAKLDSLPWWAWSDG